MRAHEACVVTLNTEYQVCATHIQPKFKIANNNAEKLPQSDALSSSSGTRSRA